MKSFDKIWENKQKDWGIIIFIGRNANEYYQVLDENEVEELVSKRNKVNNEKPIIWALDAARSVFSYLSSVCVRILQGQLNVIDIYPLFGTELLRHSRPLKILLDKNQLNASRHADLDHQKIRREIQDWLIYHDGIRRRCLILIDLLWAEAARLEDLPPSDMKRAAEVKNQTGKKIEKDWTRRLLNKR